MNEKFKSIIKWTIILIVDFIVYIFLGLLLMDYDDFYDESKGEYWSLSRMTIFHKVIYISFNIWIILNALLAIFIIYKFFEDPQICLSARAIFFMTPSSTRDFLFTI